MSSVSTPQPSPQSEVILQSLKKAVTKALEKKQKLGQYAVVWDGEKPVHTIPKT